MAQEAGELDHHHHRDHDHDVVLVAKLVFDVELFIQMELCSPLTLKDMIDDNCRKISLDIVIPFFIQVSSALLLDTVISIPVETGLIMGLFVSFGLLEICTVLWWRFS